MLASTFITSVVSGMAVAIGTLMIQKLDLATIGVRPRRILPTGPRPTCSASSKTWSWSAPGAPALSRFRRREPP